MCVYAVRTWHWTRESRSHLIRISSLYIAFYCKSQQLMESTQLADGNQRPWTRSNRRAFLVRELHSRPPCPDPFHQ